MLQYGMAPSPQDDKWVGFGRGPRCANRGSSRLTGIGSGEAPRYGACNLCRSRLGYRAYPSVGKCEEAAIWSSLDKGGLCPCRAWTGLGR
ncbi:unnamed protein product [Prunus armeniaca]